MRQRLLLRQTCVEDLKYLGQSRLECQKLQGTAVICGGSIAGLLAARVCHDHFANVIIIEPESWLSTVDAVREDAWRQDHPRTRVMQYRSLQGIQVLGFQGFYRLFPNFLEECKKSDIHVCRGDFRSSTWGNWTKTPHAEYGGNLPKTMFVGRPGLETLIRRLVLDTTKYPNIKQIIGTATGASRSSTSSERMEQVSVRKQDGSIVNIHAELIIDCTGPVSAGIKWLQREAFGHSVDGKYAKGTLPVEDLRVSYDQKINYSTLEFKVSKELGERLNVPGGWEGCGPIYNCFTDGLVESRSIYSQRIEGDIVQVCCGAWGIDDLPATLEEVKSYVRSLITDKPIPEWFFQFLDLLAEVDDVKHSRVRVPATNFNRFDKVPNLPSNWIALGDSVMRLNPVFGQGCTKALMGAVCLNTMLQKYGATALLSDFAQNFFKLQASKIGPIWEGVKLGDYTYQTTIPIKGETLSKGWLLRWYIRRLHILAFTDKQAGSALWHVKMFLAPPIDNLQFGLIVKVLWSALMRPNA
ncbi:hypothetical protein D9758_011287 [Tetrapyrgos nigripes]|uniref:Uncharacterized protein n=1 Tax=Tetrapyrgos nigripes TaxID=182062 RepID=A0A8H5CSS4_9AGAR|nr:hypothetical protein D9758_011287 [Tetrapyrgos nigripes]